MSLLADLLAKIKQPQSTREVPPNLKNIVYGSAGQSSRKMKIILLSLMFVASITAGLLLINYVKPLLDSESAISIPVTELPATVKEQQQDREDDKTAEHAITAKNKDIEALKSKTDPVQASAAPKEADSKPVKVPGKIEPSKETAAQSSVPAKEETQKKIIPEKVRSTVPGKKINAARRDALLYNARRHEMNNNYAGALSSYKKALNLDRNNIAIINNIAYMYLQLDLIEDATTFSGNALKMNMDHVPSLINFAIAQARSGNYTDAYSYLDRAIKLEPDNNSVILNLAILNERQGNDSIAFEYYSQLSNLGNTEGLLGKARIYDKTGKIKEALMLYRQALSSTMPNDSVKTEIRQRIRILLVKTRGTDNGQEKSRSTDY